MNRRAKRQVAGGLVCLAAVGTVTVAGRHLLRADELAPPVVVLDFTGREYGDVPVSSLSDVRVFAGAVIGEAPTPSWGSMLFKKALESPRAHDEMVRLAADEHAAPALYGLCGLYALQAVEFDAVARRLSTSHRVVMTVYGCTGRTSTVERFLAPQGWGFSDSQFMDYCKDLIMSGNARPGVLPNRALQRPGRKAPRR